MTTTFHFQNDHIESFQNYYIESGQKTTEILFKTITVKHFKMTLAYHL